MHTKFLLIQVTTAGFVVLWIVALAVLVGRVRTAFKRRDATRGISHEELMSGNDWIEPQSSPFATALMLAGLVVTFGFISVRLAPFLPRPLIPIVASAARLALSGSILLSWLRVTRVSFVVGMTAMTILSLLGWCLVFYAIVIVSRRARSG